MGKFRPSTKRAGDPIERFARRVESGATDEAEHEPESAELVRAADALRAVGARLPVGPSTADPLFKAALRRQLLALPHAPAEPGEAAAAAGAAYPRGRTARRVRRLVFGSVAAAGLVVVLVGTLLVPSGTPAELMRSGTEAAELSLAATTADEGRTRLRFAGDRLTEATWLAKLGGPAWPAVTAALTDLDRHARKAVVLLGETALDYQDRTALDALDAFVRAQPPRLRLLAAEVPAAVRTQVNRSVVLLARIGARSVELRASVRCSYGYAGGAGSDDLGVLPRRCAPPA